MKTLKPGVIGAVLTILTLLAITVDSASAATLGGGGGIKVKRSKKSSSGNDGYSAGEGDTVKKWEDTNAEEAKTAEKPICLYVYDKEHTKDNAWAKRFEDALGGADLSAKLKNFQMVKIDSDSKDTKGWPSAWLARGEKGAALFFISSDLSRVLTFDKNQPKESVTSATLSLAADQVLHYDSQLKLVQKKKAK